MSLFGYVFKNIIVVNKHNKTEVIAKDSKQNWAGIEFLFAPVLLPIFLLQV
jgi:hypothetical protein